MKILGIETSCDETAAAIVEDGTIIHSTVLASSTHIHRKYGGIVPEVAARKQVEYIIPVLTEALSGFSKDDIDAIAVTVGPGLIGSLLVGVETAKTLAFAWDKPIIPVNHVLAHLYANFICSEKQDMKREMLNNNFSSHVSHITFPAISLIVSGGHTEIFLMTDKKTLKWLGGTLDDAAGEAFDKTARLLGFENRGGAAIAEAAQNYEPRTMNYKLTLPRPLMDGSLNFSFSGLKTAVMREWKKATEDKQTINNGQIVNTFAYEIQEAITDVLVKKTMLAVEKYDAKSILLGGGVSANKRLREKFQEKCFTSHLSLFTPHTQLCTDNAAMIAAYAYFYNKPVSWKEIKAQPNLSVEI